MNSARNGHTATLLADGRVLVAGGQNGFFPAGQSSAEVYDPAAGLWSATGSMSTPRVGHSAVLLRDGRVLVIGGAGVSVELYDPRTGMWSSASSPSTFIGRISAVLLADGRVLATGQVDLFIPLRAEIYDSATNTWAPTGAMTLRQLDAPLTPLSGGRVLASGGFDPLLGTVASAEVYDASTGAWSTTGALAAARRGHSATRLTNGKVLVAGGFNDLGATLASAEMYDPGTGTWSVVGSMKDSRFAHTATVLSDASVLVAGGFAFSVGSSAAAEVFQPPVPPAPPSITAAQSPAPNAAGWNNSDVTVSWTLTDPTGTTSSNGCVTTVLSAETAGTTLTCIATNGAGLTASKSVTVKIDKTPPEAFARFDPAGKDLLVFGRDTLSGVAPGAIPPTSVTAIGFSDRDEPNAELRTYLVRDLADNTLTLAAKLKKDGSEIEATIVSLRYNDGAVLSPVRNQLDAKWTLADDGSLARLNQKVTVGQGDARQRVTAVFRAKDAQTTIVVRTPGGADEHIGNGEQDLDSGNLIVRPGLLLLQLATVAGGLVIEY
jgi:hypothetical protein